MARYFLEIAYKGTAFNGFQRQQQQPTIQLEIERTLQILQKHSITIMGAGRTDTGVHALQSFIHFDTENPLYPNFLFKFNAIIHKDIVCKNVYRVESNAHTRFDATSRSYIYKIQFFKNPFRNELFWFYPFKNIDVHKMSECADFLKTQDDFKSFCKLGADNKTTLCTITNAEWKIYDDYAEFHITANRFLRGMVRLIVGALLQVGLGKISIAEFKHIVANQLHFKNNVSVPAKGLYLSRVCYPYILEKISFEQKV